MENKDAPDLKRPEAAKGDPSVGDSPNGREMPRSDAALLFL